MADEKIYTTKEAGPLLYNEGFDPDLGDVAPQVPVQHVTIKLGRVAGPGTWVSLHSMSEADDIHVTLLDEDEPATDASETSKP